MVKSCALGLAFIAMLAVGCSRDANKPVGNGPGEGGGLSGGANPPAAGTTEPGANPNATVANETKMTPAEQTFVEKAAQGNQMEVDMAKLAQDKAQNSQVKDFAKQLETDHSNALDDLHRVANHASLDLDKNKEQAEKASNTMHDRMDKMTSAQFDRAWVRQMIEDHQKDIADFERMENSATGEVKEFISKTLPVMREHLQKAETLQKEMGKNTAR